MPIQRPDTPLAPTPNGDIKKTVTTNAEGVTTYRHSWNEKKSGSRTAAKPASKTPVKTVTKKTETSGKREFSTFTKPQAAGIKKQEISATEMKAEKKFVPTTRKEKVIENKITDYKKNKQSDESFEDYRKRTQERANINSAKAKGSSGGKTEFSKKFGSRSSSCRNC